MSGLPTEIAASLGERASDARHERIGAGIDSFLGETHLVVIAGVLRAWARGSSFDPLVELADLSSARIEPGGLGAELRLAHASGESRVRLGHAEQQRIAALLESVEASASRAPEAPVVEAPVAEAPAAQAPQTAEVDLALSEQRARFLGVLRGAHAQASGRAELLGVLGARRSTRAETLRATHERRERERTASESEAAPKPASEAAPKPASEAASKPASKHASKAVKRSGSARRAVVPAPELEARVGEAWIPPAAPAAPKRSALPWVVLVLLVLAGALPALDKLLSSP